MTSSPTFAASISVGFHSVQISLNKGVFALWFLLSFVFFPFGKFISRIGKDAMEEMNRDEKDNKNEKESK